MAEEGADEESGFVLRRQCCVVGKARCIGIDASTIIDNYTTRPRFLRADSQRGAAELTIACRKRGRVV